VRRPASRGPCPVSRPAVVACHLHTRTPNPLILRHPSFVLRLLLVLPLLTALACNTLLPPRPPIEWNTAPEAVIAQAHTGGGMLYEPNLTYHASLWGDGRIIWTGYDNQGRRELFITTLSAADMTALLQDFVDAGFFGWDTTYSPGLVYDAPSSCLSVSLAAAYQSVCEVLEGAPRPFGPLYARLASGAGGPAAPYVPERAYLRLNPAGPNAATAPWPAELTPTLAIVARQGGAWIEGDALAFAWAAVNAEPLQPVFQEAGAYYSVQLLVPGVTVISPPAPTPPSAPALPLPRRRR